MVALDGLLSNPEAFSQRAAAWRMGGHEAA